ncbi:SH3 domain-containing protein [Exiguobacterium acetylicum]|uniref:SH3 domain-containing protein n=1 Tax=Exiguobacterium acetylicum TaxID=41170 RepID=UPI0034D3C1ED
MNTTSFSKTLKVFASFLVVFSIVLTSLPMAEAATTKATTYRLSTDSYLYDKTASSRKRLLTIKTGTVVSSTYASGSFRRVTYAGKTGYVASKYLTLYEKKQTVSGQRYLVLKKTPIKKTAVDTATTIGTLNKEDVYYTSQRVTNPYGETWYRVKYDGKTGYVAAGAKAVAYKKVTNTTLKTIDAYILRQYAGTGYPKVQTIPSGKDVKVVGRIEKWVSIQYDGKTGYMHQDAFASSEKQNVTLIPQTRYQTKSVTPLYSQAEAKQSLASLPKGTVVTSNAKTAIYHQVTYAGKTGYVLSATLAEYTEKTKLPSSRFLLTSPLVIRTTPAANGEALATLSAGNVYYTKTRVTNPLGETWHQVSKEGKIGFVPANQGTAIAYETESNLSLKTTASTAIRSYAGPSYATVQTIPSNTVIKISGRIGNWYRVSYNGKTGYAASNTFTTLATKQTISGARFELENTVSIKSSPDAQASTLATLQSGDIYYTTQLVTSNGQQWHRVSKDGKTGYIPVNQGKSVQYQSDRIVMQTTTSTPLRSYAGNTYATVKTIPSGTSITVTGMIDDWYRVTYSGKTGYIASRYAKEKITTQSIPSSYYRLGRSVEVKASHHATAETVVRLSSGDVYTTNQVVTNGHSEQWHRLTVDGKTGYVQINQGSPITYESVNNHRYQATTDTTLQSDAGSAYATVTKLPKAAVVQVTGSLDQWLKISYAGKNGYVLKSTLTPYTETKKITGARFLANESLVVKQAPDDQASNVTTLAFGNVYYTSALITSYTNTSWYKVTIDGKTGYIRTGQNTSSIKYESKDKMYVRATSDAALRSYVGSSYNVIKTIPKNLVVTVSGQIGDWYKISYDGKSGYAYKGAFVTTSSKLNVYNSVATPYTFDTFISAQMKLNPPPQTDIYKDKLMYVSTGYVRLGGALDPVNGTIATVTATTPLNIRSGASTASHVYGQFQPGRMIRVYQSVSGFYTTKPRVYTSATSGYSTIQWLNALETDVRDVADPLKVDRNSSAFYQFLDLSKTTGASAATLDKMLANVTKGLGIFNKCSNGSCGQAFIDAGQKYSVNEAYLISHALLETGNGQSTLAMGVTWNGRKVYNMYGIGAYDYDAINTGAAYAYKMGWFTPEAAIVGGAEFISTKYIHNEYGQNTLYKMRWSPMRPGSHQYATDMGWAVKQTSRIYSLYQQMDSYTAVFDIPVFAR